TPEDFLLVHSAAHGHVFEGKPYLVTSQTRHLVCPDTAVPLDRIKEEMRRSAAGIKLLILDLCYSGNLEQTPGRTADGYLFSERDAIAILTSCRISEQCFEDTELGYGVFTRYLIEGLAGKADEDKKGYVTLRD